MAGVTKIISSRTFVFISRRIYVYICIYYIYIYIRIHINVQNASLPIYVWPGDDECLNAHRKLIEKRREVPGGNPGI